MREQVKGTQNSQRRRKETDVDPGNNAETVRYQVFTISTTTADP